MIPNKFPSFFLALCLHLALAALILFLPNFGISAPETPRNVLISGMVTLGKEGRAAPAPVRPTTGTGEKAPKPVEKPAASEPKTVAQVEKPAKAEPKPEVKPVEKPPEAPKPKPEPKPEAVPIPKEPEKKKTPEKKKPPQTNATKKKEPEKNTAAKKDPPKKSQTPAKKKSATDEALLALNKEVKQQEAKQTKEGNAKAPKGQRPEDVLAAWGEELGSPNEDMQGQGSGGDMQGDGPGGRGGDGQGSPGEYYEVIISRVRQNWSMTQRADRATYVAVVNIQIAPDGSIVNRQIITSSGNALYDTAVLLAIDNTTNLEPPPSPDLRNINIEFDSNEMNR